VRSRFCFDRYRAEAPIIRFKIRNPNLERGPADRNKLKHSDKNSKIRNDPVLNFVLFDHLNFYGFIPSSLLRNGDFRSSQSPSFPHAFSGNAGETLTHSTGAQGHGEQGRTMTGPPIKTFGGDNLGKDYHKGFSPFLDAPQLAAG